MIRSVLRRLIAMLDAADRRRCGGLAVFVLGAALLEMLGLGMVIPLIKLLNDPESALKLALAARLYQALDLQRPGDLVIVAGLAFFGLVLLKMGWNWSLVRLQHHVLAGICEKVAARIFRTTLYRPYEDSLAVNSAVAIRNCEDSIIHILPPLYVAAILLLSELTIAIGVVSVMVLVEPLASLLCGGGIGGAIIGLTVMTRRRAAHLGARGHHLSIYRQALLQQSLGSLKEVKVFGREAFFTTTYLKVVHDTVTTAARHVVLQTVPRLAIEGLMVGAVVLVVIGVQWLGRSPADVTPILAMFAFGVFRLLPSATRILHGVTLLQSSFASVDSIYQDYCAPSAEVPVLAATPFPPPRHEIRIDDLHFSYRGSARPVLRGASCVIPIGASIGIVGGSGAGKTTLMDCLLGLLEPQSGRILVDGRDIATDRRGWQRHLGYIPQQIVLNDDSLRRNIAFGLPDAAIDEDRLAEVVRLAQLQDFVAGLPAGLDTPVGERGAKLSGGQRQRIGIARALYHQPEILIADEATSALDNQTEYDVMAAIDALRGQKTLFVIAHRLSTVRHCDLILLMQDGVIIDSGPFDILEQRNPAFRALVALGVGGAPA